VALGTPVFTVFEGRLGAVDERLIADGRLARLESPAQLVLAKRPRTGESQRVRRDVGRFVALLCRPLSSPALNPAQH
jgi:hypothetical protein